MAFKSSKNGLISSILDSIDFYQLRNGFVVRSHLDHENLPLISHMLLEVCSKPGISVGALREILCVPKTTLLRYKDHLILKRMIKESRSKEDARVVQLYLTGAGETFLDQVNERNELIVREAIKRLEEDKLPQLVTALKKFADNLDASEFRLKGVSLLRSEILRVTRGLELLNNRVKGRYLKTSIEYQMLRIVSESQSGEPPSQLSRVMGCPANTLSFLIKKLLKVGLVKKERVHTDLRSSKVHITEKGRTELKDIKEALGDRIAKGLSTFSASEAGQFADLLSVFVGRSGKDDKSSLRVVLISDSAELGGIRRQVAAFLVEAGDEIPHEILPPTSRNIAVFCGDTPIHVFEFSVNAKVALLRASFSLFPREGEILSPTVIVAVKDELQRVEGELREFEGVEALASKVALFRESLTKLV